MAKKKNKRQPKFKVGDLVAHRASGKKGVITEIYSYCAAHGGLEKLTEHMLGRNCDYEFNGLYQLSLDLEQVDEDDKDKNKITCEEILLQRADDKIFCNFEMTKEKAKTIISLYSACDHEGVGPPDEDVMKYFLEWIKETYPALTKDEPKLFEEH